MSRAEPCVEHSIEWKKAQRGSQKWFGAEAADGVPPNFNCRTMTALAAVTVKEWST